MVALIFQWYFFESVKNTGKEKQLQLA